MLTTSLARFANVIQRVSCVIILLLQDDEESEEEDVEDEETHHKLLAAIRATSRKRDVESREDVSGPAAKRRKLAQERQLQEVCVCRCCWASDV